MYGNYKRIIDCRKLSFNSSNISVITMERPNPGLLHKFNGSLFVLLNFNQTLSIYFIDLMIKFIIFDSKIIIMSYS